MGRLLEQSLESELDITVSDLSFCQLSFFGFVLTFRQSNGRK